MIILKIIPRAGMNMPQKNSEGRNLHTQSSVALGSSDKVEEVGAGRES